MNLGRSDSRLIDPNRPRRPRERTREVSPNSTGPRSIHHPAYPYTATTSSDDSYASGRGKPRGPGPIDWIIQDRGYGLRRINLLRGWVNRGSIESTPYSEAHQRAEAEHGEGGGAE